MLIIITEWLTLIYFNEKHNLCDMQLGKESNDYSRLFRIYIIPLKDLLGDVICVILSCVVLNITTTITAHEQIKRQ